MSTRPPDSEVSLTDPGGHGPMWGRGRGVGPEVSSEFSRSLRAAFFLCAVFGQRCLTAVTAAADRVTAALSFLSSSPQQCHHMDMRR